MRAPRGGGWATARARRVRDADATSNREAYRPSESEPTPSGLLAVQLAAMRGLRVLAVAENQEQRAALEVVRGHIERKHLYGAVVRAAENELAKRGAAVRASVAAAADGAAAVDDGGAIDTGGAATVGGASYRGGYNDAGAFGSISILNLGRTTAAAASTKSSSSSSSSSSAASPLSLSAAVAAETAAAAVAAATSAAAAAGTAATETATAAALATTPIAVGESSSSGGLGVGVWCDVVGSVTAIERMERDTSPT